MDKGLSLKNVTISKGGVPLLSLSHDIGPGEVLTVMGPSGVGKSTLLAFITGTLAPEFQASGEVWLDGHNITHAAPHQRRVGILFQDDLLFPHLSVGANLAFGLQPGGNAAERKAKVDEALEEVGMSGFADRDPATLSGGQKARVALMRMLQSAHQQVLPADAAICAMKHLWSRHSHQGPSRSHRISSRAYRRSTPKHRWCGPRSAQPDQKLPSQWFEVDWSIAPITHRPVSARQAPRLNCPR